MLLFEVLFKPRRFVNFDSYVLPKGKSEEGKEEKEGKERKGIGREKREARGGFYRVLLAPFSSVNIALPSFSSKATNLQVFKIIIS